MKRRDFLAGLGAAATTAAAGCLTSDNTDAAATDSNRGGLIATVIDGPPEDATVTDATLGRVGNNEAIQTVVNRAKRNEVDYALLQLDSERFTAIQSTLNNVPRYTGRNGPTGYYLQHGNQPILLYPFFLNPSDKQPQQPPR